MCRKGRDGAGEESRGEEQGACGGFWSSSLTKKSEGRHFYSLFVRVIIVVVVGFVGSSQFFLVSFRAPGARMCEREREGGPGTGRGPARGEAFAQRSGWGDR